MPGAYLYVYADGADFKCPERIYTYMRMERILNAWRCARAATPAGRLANQPAGRNLYVLCTCVSTRVCVYMHVHTLCICMCIHAYMHTRIHAYTHTCIRAWIDKC